jgi:Tfp pilus assembly protein FimT
MSLPELLVVISILGLGVMVSIPLIADRVQNAKIRAAASQLAVSLRAARMVAVSRQIPVVVTLAAAPDNTYQFADADGQLRVTRLPDGAWIDGALSSPSIAFAPDGSLSVPATAVIKSTLSSGGVETWTIEVPVTGIPVMSRESDGD